MAIPLFKLPILVIKLVFEVMGFIDIFVLTNTSSKTKQFVKNLLTCKNQEMHIFMGKEAFFFSLLRDSHPTFLEQIHWKSGERQPQEVFYLKIGTIDHVPSEFLPAKDGHAALAVYLNENINHGEVIYNAIIDLFKIPIKHIRMDLNDFPNEIHRSWIIFFNENLSTASLLEIVGKCTFRDYFWILDYVNTKNMFAMRADQTDFSDDYGHHCADYSFEGESIVVSDGRWICREDLRSIDARSINIARILISVDDINKYLRDWKNMKKEDRLDLTFLNLKELTIIFEYERNRENLLEGLEATNEDLIMPVDVLNQWSFKMANGDKCTVTYAKYEGDDKFEFRVGN
ncbi:hypothetical protein CAEBREN_21722 [Caenorhabditis brenneri]|uniref:Sdz-33 F-box domain-containing protein n=1 Tax=Caenorhabditis brenneri TaxID=135651 RepID=G0P3T3_CAEBE|nr:hypothetical protein CAEBREN_21722 [Caenorhabditis brenneri]